MAKNPSSLSAYRPFFLLGGLVLVTATLYWAQKVLIPLTLAVLLTFILGPFVTLIQRRWIPRVPATLAVVFLALLVVVGVGSGLTLQVKRLAGELPQYKDNIARKVASVRGLGDGGWLRNLRDTFHVITGEPAAAEPVEGAAPQPAPGRVRSSVLPELGTLAGPAAETLGAAGLVVVLVGFMLVQREALRNRLVRLVPHGRLLSTTRALTEAAARLSRFLFVQLLVNAGYGLVVGAGLFLIGVPYALVWAILAALLRYFPYVGTFLTIALITVFSVAAFPGWLRPLFVLAFLVVLEVIAANVVEPLLFSHSTGVSPLALLIALAFWTWLWGPIGLVLSTPLTVCLMVVGRYVPRLEFLGVLLGDEAGVDPEINFYQRLLARDQDEAAELTTAFTQAHPPGAVYDDVLVPALIMARCDRDSDELTPEAERFIYRATRDILDDFPVSRQQDPLADGGAIPTEDVPGPLKPLVLGCPARDEADELTLHMLAQLVDPSACRFEVVPAGTLAGEVASRVKKEGPAALCIAALPPGGLAQSYALCKRLRGQFPGLKILIGIWGDREKLDGAAGRLKSGGADVVVASIAEARDQLTALLRQRLNVNATSEPA